MAAACSVRDFEQSVLPYLRRPDNQTKFYNLYPASHGRRRGTKLLDFVMRGSLLSWIDEFFANPMTPTDKTLGRYVNFLRTEQIFSPDELRGRIYQKEFHYGNSVSDTDPQKHGDFDRCPFLGEGVLQSRALIAGSEVILQQGMMPYHRLRAVSWRQKQNGPHDGVCYKPTQKKKPHPPHGARHRRTPAPATAGKRYSPSRQVSFDPEARAVESILVKYEWRVTLCSKRMIHCGRPTGKPTTGSGTTTASPPPPPVRP